LLRLEWVFCKDNDYLLHRNKAHPLGQALSGNKLYNDLDYFATLPMALTGLLHPAGSERRRRDIIIVNVQPDDIGRQPETIRFL
jgi:hypothetical protein